MLSSESSDNGTMERQIEFNEIVHESLKAMPCCHILKDPRAMKSVLYFERGCRHSYPYSYVNFLAYGFLVKEHAVLRHDHLPLGEFYPDACQIPFQ